VAEVGFIVYSWLVENWVFVVTNAVLLAENLVGLGIVLHHRRRAAGGAPTSVRDRALVARPPQEPAA
jgi:MtN3 and saliva related transmembrane protein